VEGEAKQEAPGSGGASPYPKLRSNTAERPARYSNGIEAQVTKYWLIISKGLSLT
jgi:hypothetical protein